MQHILDINQISIEGCNERMFIDFFSIDNDFCDNQEYFREDTLELGFENEAERCSKELFDKYKDKFFEGAYEEVLDEALEEAANKSIDGCQFILGNSTYTRQYYISVICTNSEENEYTVVTSRMGY